MGKAASETKAAARHKIGDVVPWDGRGTVLVVASKTRKSGRAYKGLIRGKDVEKQHGKKAISKTLGRLTDIKTWLRDKAGELERGEVRSHQSHTVGELAEKMAQDIWNGGKRWHKQNIRIIQLWWLPRLGEQTKLEDLTAERLQALVTELGPTGIDGNGLSTKSVRLYAKAFGRCLNLAEKWGWLPINPWRRVTLPAEPPKRLPRIPSKEELAHFLATIREVSGENIGDLALAAVSTAARKEELLSLKVRHVDSQSWGRVVLVKTKGEKPRTIPIMGTEAQEMFRRRCEGRHLDAPVFDTVTLVHARWDKGRNAAGFGEIRFHDLRHWAASFLAMSGASLRQLVGYLGHADFSQVMRYAHLCEHALDEVAGKAARQYFDTDEGAREITDLDLFRERAIRAEEETQRLREELEALRDQIAA